jgi:Na+/proline symporter
VSNYDNAVLASYFVCMASLGLVFRKFSKNSSDYFRGGGNVLWWLVGATAFMSQFSAWTFTGAASKAYGDGLLVCMIFFGNGLGYLIAYWVSAARFRQIRVITPMDGVRDRFGKGNEQFFTWIWLPIGTLYAGIWLDAVSTFASVVFGWDVITTILIVGAMVVFVSGIGGSWAIVASDFMQMLGSSWAARLADRPRSHIVDAVPYAPRRARRSCAHHAP